jgi:hypothetical protein
MHFALCALLYALCAQGLLKIRDHPAQMIQLVCQANKGIIGNELAPI